LYAFFGMAHILIYLDLTGIALAAAWAWPRRRPHLPPGLLPVTVLFVSFLPAMAFVSGDAYSLGKVLRMLTLTPFVTVSAVLVFREQSRRAALVWAFAGSGTVVGVLTLLAPNPLLLARGIYALRGNNTIGTARIVGFGVVALLCLTVLTQRRLVRLAALATAAGLMVPLLATGSRGPLIALVAAGLVFAASLPRERWRSAFSALGGAVAVAGVMYVLRPTAVPDRLGVLVSGQPDTSFAARLDLWSAAASAITDHPLGLGWGNFAHVSPLGTFVTMSGSEGSYLYPHNIILEVGCEGGWIALLGLGIFAIAVLRAARIRSTDHYTGALTALAVFALVNALVSADINGNLLLLALAGAILATARPRGVGRTGPTVS
jgi:O-antigen ligase